MTSTSHSADDAHDYKLVQCKLNQVGVRKQVKLPLKEKYELKNLYAKWTYKDPRPLMTAENYGLESLASMSIKIGKKIDRKVI